VLVYTYYLSGEPIVSWQGPWRVVPILLGSAALFFLVAGALRYDLRQFLGLRQLEDEKACSVLTDDCTLDTDGVLSVVRHPWYSAGILVVWARPLDLAAILTNLVVSAYFVVGAMQEERKLKVQFGRQYADYQQRVSMLLPIRWVRSRLFRRD
jgi:protein-S-isoprenylcysteine O-methyltransferase Ste14